MKWAALYMSDFVRRHLLSVRLAACDPLDPPLYRLRPVWPASDPLDRPDPP